MLRAAMTTLRPIADVAAELGLGETDLFLYGRHVAKVEPSALARPATGAGRLVLVSAITPTPAGEGKTTVSCALAMGLRANGKRVALCLREPSLGPVFGVKGGGTGGGRAQVVPSDVINLHFTGDLHAVGSANNLLAALVDNDLHFEGRAGLDPRRVTWRRCLDMNDRSLREVVVGLGGKTGGVPRQTGFDITAASEVMAILCLAQDLSDLERRLDRIVVGFTRGDEPVTARAVSAAAAMTALLERALRPNLVQTTEGGPALVHGGPFANIAHGCSSVVSTRLAMHAADYVVTEAGFAFDLGGEKFLHIKCRQAGFWPRAVVLVATLRALKSHGGAPLAECKRPNADALRDGLPHLDKHLDSVRAFGLQPIVAVNVFGEDREDELRLLEMHCAAQGVPCGRSTAFTDGSAGATDLARLVAEVVDATDASPPKPKFLYDLEEPYLDKLRAVARTVYGADDVVLSPGAARDLARLSNWGHGNLPVCVAKTHLSLSDDPKRIGRPRGFTVTVREVRLSAGAGFVVALMGDILTMPGLPREPAAMRVRIDPDGRVRGLMQND
jgi:formate--tetrahydrofolate ligase